MKVLQINCLYKNGSTGRIVENIHKYLLKNNIESVILYGRDKVEDEENVYKISSEFEANIHAVEYRLFSVEYGYSPIATKKAISIIKKENPNVVHLHVLNGNFINVYSLLDFLKFNHIKTVVTLHAEIFHTAGCEHALDCEKWKPGCHNCKMIDGALSKYFRDDAKHCSLLMKKAFSGFDDLSFVGVSKWLTDRAKQSDIITGGKFYTVHNGLDSSVFHYTYDENLRKKLNIDNGKKMILHVTPNFYSPIKGGKYVIELANRMPEYQFVIVGFNGDKQTLPDNIFAVQHTKDSAELAKYYSVADCVICTSLRETFSMVALEAISCGTKMVSFNAGGITEIIPPERGEYVECYNIDAFETAVKKWADVEIDEEDKNKFCSKSDLSIMAEKYVEIYKS